MSSCSLPKDVISNHILPFMEATDLAILACVGRSFRELTAKEPLWEKLWMVSPTHERSKSSDTSWKAHYARGYYPIFYQSETKRTARANQHLYNASVSVVFSINRIFSIGSHCVAYMYNCYFRSLSDPIVHRDACVDQLKSQRDQWKIMAETRLNTRIDCLGWTETEAYLSAVTRAYHRYETILKIIDEQFRSTACVRGTQCLTRAIELETADLQKITSECEETSWISWVGGSLCVPSILFITFLNTNNYQWDMSRTENQVTKRINLICGGTLVALGCLTKMTGNNAGDFSISSGLWFMAKGIIPQQKLNRFCGEVVGRTRSAALAAFGGIKRGFWKFDRLVQKTYSTATSAFQKIRNGWHHTQQVCSWLGMW